MQPEQIDVNEHTDLPGPSHEEIARRAYQLWEERGKPVGAELLVDWRSATGQAHGKLMGDFLPFSGNNTVGFLAAKGAK